MKVDAHQHFWVLERGDYTWLNSESGVLYRDYLPNDLMLHLGGVGIARTVVVQAAPTRMETEFLLEIAQNEETVAGVVGWLDLESSSFPNEFAMLRKKAKFVGIRPMLQDIQDDKWILRDKVIDNLRVLVNEDFPLDLLIYPRHIPYITELFDRLPKLRGVINHMAKPNIVHQERYPWLEAMRELSAHPTIMCKISGFVTRANCTNWSVDDIRPFVADVIELFGVNRVMYGSDWPVCLLGANYPDVYAAVMHALPPFMTEADLAKIFGENAIHFYHLSL
ncbi:amidohydrolase family protein [Alicyclobacillus tolerans]|uniref:amidohydrolase family protein n=1 Tax=Alicyclobacillus tolerans TaxID=90970 RepID=UPI001F4015DF|nr:amidohydrolase family protein [Alicyclobacillus tolerans]MCF8568466.1 amidohydrolase family protein [Alicyclobacillus tolerans]